MTAMTIQRGTRRVVGGFGRAVASAARFAAPANEEELLSLLGQARAEGLPVALRGAGRSYGDAAMNAAGLILDLSAMNAVLDWNPETGVMVLEGAATIESIWRRALPDGWWPTVVPGTMFPTVAGCVAMNVHGKNHYRVGAFGDQVLELDLLTVEGEKITCGPEVNADVFEAVIGGLGVLGVVTRVTLQLKHVGSGDLEVEALSVPDLDALFNEYERRREEADYLVGWIDCFARGANLGRGVIHRANYVPLERHPAGADSLDPSHQTLPDRFFGVIPRGLMWRLLKPWVNDLGMRLVNASKYWASRLFDRAGTTFKQSHVGFAFLLDYVPRWRDTYGLGGFIQVQPFIPAQTARVAFRELIETCHEHGVIPYLGVFKRHRPDQFVLSHAIDGYSLALDIRVPADGRERVWKLGEALGDVVVRHGGRIYFAKDALANAGQIEACYGPDRIERFLAMKERLDPNGLLSSELSRRVLPQLPVVGTSTP
ncbi:MAG: FAD-binding protein [Deltaproteobacteria bacterium]|nr:FAD-binding protein [Deltaproteobacteria bacterium]